MPIVVSRDKQPDNTVKTTNYYKPLNNLKSVPMFLAPESAVKAIEAYRSMLADWHKFDGEYLKAINDGTARAAVEADKADARKAVEAGKPVKDPRKNQDAYAAKAAEYEVRREVFLEKLVEAENAVERELGSLGDDGLIEKALDIAEQRAAKYRQTISAMLDARQAYQEAVSAIAWAVGRAAAHDDGKPAALPPGKIPPPVQRPFEPVDVDAILRDSERHKGRLDLLVGGVPKSVNAARKFMYKRLKDDPGFDPNAAPSGARKDRFI